MKIATLSKLVLIWPLLCSSISGPSQASGQASSQASAPPLPAPVALPPPPPLEKPSKLQVFDLHFKGGVPRDLVEAIKMSTGQELNVIIPDDCAEDRIPPLQMRNITVQELFQALARATAKGVPTRTASGQVTIHQSSQSFSTVGEPNDSSIWYYSSPKPPVLPKVVAEKGCRFYQIGPYLQYLTVEDIVTAIETGWELMYEGVELPRIKFHPETKLLIAVGDPTKLSVVEDMLRQLERPSTKAPGPGPTTPNPSPSTSSPAGTR